MPTGDPREVYRLNELLGRELGRNPVGSPIFQWEWSDDLFWPAYQTGRTTPRKQIVHVPLVDGSGSEALTMEEVLPEYSRDRQTIRRETWFVTKWLSAADLIHGGTQGHGQISGPDPDIETLKALWNQKFRGADFPFQGWRVPTDAFLPRSPQDPSVPNEPDTLFFIARIKDQTSLHSQERLSDMLDQAILADQRSQVRIVDEIADLFPAQLNPHPGSRASWVSFPYSRKDRL